MRQIFEVEIPMGRETSRNIPGIAGGGGIVEIGSGWIANQGILWSDKLWYAVPAIRGRISEDKWERNPMTWWQLR
jgi:hypothetical protein